MASALRWSSPSKCAGPARCRCAARAYSLRQHILHLEKHALQISDLEPLLERVVYDGLVHLRHGRRRLTVEDDVADGLEADDGVDEVGVFEVLESEVDAKGRHAVARDRQRARLAVLLLEYAVALLAIRTRLMDCHPL